MTLEQLLLFPFYALATVAQNRQGGPVAMNLEQNW